MDNSIEIQNHIRVQRLISVATKHIRKLFLEVWKITHKSDWIDNDQCGREIDKQIGSCNPMQRKLLLQGDSNSWDISLQYQIFYQVFNSSKYLNPIREIKDIRNEVSHNATMELETKKLDELIDKFKAALLKLEFVNKELEEVLSTNLKKTKPKLSDDDKEKLLSIKNEAKEKLAMGDYKAAADLYTKAIVLNGINDQDLGILYSNRSLVYSKLHKVERSRNDRNLTRALNDANSCIELYPEWPKGYARLGSVYKEFNDFKLSIESYQKSVFLAPDNEEFKNALADVKRIDSERERHEHLNPNAFPLTYEEHGEKLNERLDQMFGENPKRNETLLNEVNKIQEIDPVLKDVFKAHEYRDGSERVSQSYEMAAKHYAKAMVKGNAEAYYNLALLTQQGKGVEKDYKLALNYFKQAANQPAKRKLSHIEIPNVGKAEAEHSLALAYYGGIYVEKDVREAIKWYERAVEHNCAPSANNLGLIYFGGEDVEQDLDKAERLFILGYKLGDFNTMINLVNLYLEQGNREMALMWHERALEKGCLFSINRDEEVRQHLKDKHKTTYLGKREKEIVDLIQEISSLNVKQSPASKVISYNKYDTDMLKYYAINGSQTAQKMLSAIEIFHEGLEEIANDFVRGLSKLAEAFKIESFVCLMTEEMKHILSIYLMEKCIDYTNNTSQLDYDARICYMFLQMNDMENTIKFIDASLEKYQNAYEMIMLRGSLYAFLNQFQKTLKDYNSCLKVKPSDIEVIYLKAASLRQAGNSKEAIKSYESFISKAPKDHRKLPESYYSIGTCVMDINKKSSLKKLKDNMNEYYRKGEVAEKDQLPCFLPYSSGSKICLSNILKMLCISDQYKLEEKTRPAKNQTDAHRINLFKMHRNGILDMKKMENFRSMNQINLSVKPPKTQRMSKTDISDFKRITLREIDTTKDHVLEGCILGVTLIDQPLTGLTSVHFLIQDDLGFVEKMSIYNLGSDYEKIKKDFAVGTKLDLVNPYFRLSADATVRIRIDDPKSVIVTGKVDHMCCLCGAGNSKFKCGQCGVSRYCSKECQTNDWKLADHKLICQ